MKEINFFFPEFDFDKWNVDYRKKFIDGRYVFDLEDVVHRPIWFVFFFKVPTIVGILPFIFLNQ